jgi:TolB-like protein
MRDQLIPVLDADIEDLGACYVKHVNEAVRAYRVGPPGPRPVIEPGSAAMPELRPTVAVIPFAARAGEAAHQVLGEVLADEIISALSRAADLNVISRLSTTVFAGATYAEKWGLSQCDVCAVRRHLASGNQFSLSAELADAKSGNVVWAKTSKGRSLASSTARTG